MIFGQLGAAAEPRSFYRELERTEGFQRPLTWTELDVKNYDGLILPGGHAPGMRQYLGSDLLQKKVAEFWKLGRYYSTYEATQKYSRGVLARCFDRSGRQIFLSGESLSIC